MVCLGAGAAALAFNLLLVFAFLAPTRSIVAAIVREKELRLREGMRMLGLQARGKRLLCEKCLLLYMCCRLGLTRRAGLLVAVF